MSNERGRPLRNKLPTKSVKIETDLLDYIKAVKKDTYVKTSLSNKLRNIFREYQSLKDEQLKRIIKGE